MAEQKEQNLNQTAEQTNANEIYKIQVGNTPYSVVDTGAGRSIDIEQAAKIVQLKLKDKAGTVIDTDEFEALTIPTITLSLSQVIESDPLTLQLTNEQAAIIENPDYS